ncbi:DUF4893 domain-containing protein [Allosphingosinicella sp.]|jgi:hypothetical protein|uniref:DUF4893 domain-containing protein n=1 Tax=Allosphingosinicella sp. TaxID=2823234 RepID=UPI002F1E4A5B
MRSFLSLLPPALAAFLLPSCASSGGAEERLIPTWRALATEDDRRRLREWRDAWTEALDEARAAGHSAEIAAEGALLEPDSALPGSALPSGDYRCRTIKLGSRGDDGLAFVAYPAFRCRVTPGADGLLHLAKVGGSQRPVGRLLEEHNRWMIFLGTLQLGDERSALSYGRDRERNLAGRLERVGEQRWRIAFPFPHFESLLDVLELVPAS